jgi:light-regulated signal transduction histidine kinase (bacteriophytochrome)
MASYEIEHRIVRPGTNQIRWVQEKCRYERDGTGSAVRAVGMVLDITLRVEAEEALRRMAEDLARSNSDLEQFAFVASHDLQEPLRMVSSYVQLLERRYKGKLDPDADEFIEYAVNGAKRMRNLINDLLAYSRISKGPREFQPIPVEAILRQVEADLELSIQASGGTVTHGPLPTIKADPGQLAQVLQNLIGNALKFKGDRPPQVHIAAQRGKDAWLFSVRDNGIGFDPRYSDQIFVIFQRLQGGEKFPGTGIGLAVCKRILERHGGRIWAESTPGEGSVFHFAIPD